MTHPPQRSTPWILLLFVGSGCSALIYEVVWFQLLELVVGATTVSLGVLLAAFMGGLCAGSILYARFAMSADAAGTRTFRARPTSSMPRMTQ